MGKLSEAEAREQYVRLVHQVFPSWQPDDASQQPRGTPAGPVSSSLAHSKGDIVVPDSVVSATELLSGSDRQDCSQLESCRGVMQASDSLHIRASEGDVAGVKKLLKSGIAVDQRDDQGCTALHWAADRGAEQVCYVSLEVQNRCQW